MLILTLKVGHLEHICFPGRCESVLGSCEKNLPVFQAPENKLRSTFGAPHATRSSPLAHPKA